MRTVLPVIERELRAEARHAVTYWLRALGASVALIIFAVMMIEARDNAPGLGLCVLLPVILPFSLVLALTLVGGSLAYNPFWPRVNSLANLLVLTSGFQTVFALIAATRLYRNLRHRKFALAP